MKNLKIGIQLILGFCTMLVFVIVLGVVSYRQSALIQQQVVIMYNHPIKVRKAIGDVESDILKMRLGLRDMMLSENSREYQDAIQSIELAGVDAQKQFDILNDQYLGPHADIDEASKAFNRWKIARAENIRLALAGEVKKVKENLLPDGDISIFRDKMLSAIRKIDEFAENKSESLYNSSIELKETLNRQLFLLVIAILILSLIIYNFLLDSIRKPVTELTKAAKWFHSGDMNARSSYRSQNEFGLLSHSFNSMVKDIQINKSLDEKLVNLAGLMLSENDARRFFQATLNALVSHTDSQMAAVYLLSEDKKTFEYFESTGTAGSARKSFDASDFEGEFCAVLSSRKVQHLNNIPEDTRFVFQTVSGKFIPREIITIPIVTDHEVLAIISLATISSFSKQSVRLIDNILVTLCARVDGILAFHKIKEFSAQLENQNRELEVQKTKLASQSAELTEQNMELEIQKNQLQEVSRLKTNFLSNMSHELRTPLNSVIALSGVLNRKLANKIESEEYSYLEVIERNGKHLLALINDILDISRIEAGREEIDISSFDVGNLVQEVMSMINPQAQQKNIELTYVEKDIKINLTSDIDKCRHILQNLIANAVKFTEKGSVKISALQTETQLTVSVTDTGIGISEKHIPHIFDEFRQADGSTSRKFGGTGLGLAIAKKYANLLRGTISVSSNPGIGSIFILTLPLSYSDESAGFETKDINRLKHSVHSVNLTPACSISGKTILLVEDSEPAVIQIKDMLEESGYRILVARDGHEGLEIIAQTIPDAMILDLMMPGIDGFEVLKTLREAIPTAHIPVLILTAKHITKEELRFLKRNNVHQLIQKGDVNRNDLLNAIAEMVSPEKSENLISS